MADADLKISQLGPLGDGIHRGPTGTIYVDRAIPGDRVKAIVQRDAQGINRGEITEILEPSPHRQAPPCEHYDRCGSCTLQHLNEGYYREWKVKAAEEAFTKQGLRPGTWLAPHFIEGSNRRRITFSASRRHDKITIGYYRRRTKIIMDLDSCLVADPILFGLRETLKPLLPSLLMHGRTIDISLQLVGDAIDMVITGPVGRRGEADASVAQVLEELLVLSPVTRISWRLPEREEVKILLSKDDVTAVFGSLKVDLPPAAFLQPTVEGEKVLVSAVMAALPAKGKFADLFSGCGTFSGPLLKNGSVEAYEFSQTAVSALAKGAQGKPLKAFRRDLFHNPLTRDEIDRFDAVVFNPPRSGCPEQAATMALAKTSTLIGVSCNPVTFARDARVLCAGGYKLQSLQVVDQFHWSHHVEVVGVFTKT